MKTPVSEWTEDSVLSLPQHENDTFERKGAVLLDRTHPRANEDAFLNELAKQLSAFANTGGGQIIYGLDDSGAVDSGGIARSVRGRQSTKEWLESLIPTLTDFEILGFNVYEILPKSTGSSRIDPNKSFADSAPATEQEFGLTAIDTSQQLRRAVFQAAGYTRQRRA
jgi:predicted HTH transcriptional regulator